MNYYFYIEFQLSISNNNLYIESIKTTYTTQGGPTNSNYNSGTAYSTLDQQPYFTELHINVPLFGTMAIMNNITSLETDGVHLNTEL